MLSAKMIYGEYFHAVLPPYIPRVINAIENPRWRPFLTLRIIVMHNHVAFAAEQGSPANSYTLRLTNTEGVINEENKKVSPLLKKMV
jgi:hypothetical protein